jgi:hypothetical protein
MSSGDLSAAEFTLVESPEAASRGLVVRRVADADKKAVRRWGGFLFATMAEAEAFAQTQMLFGEDGPPWAGGRSRTNASTGSGSTCGGGGGAG